jgi:hypothetical protein
MWVESGADRTHISDKQDTQAQLVLGRTHAQVFHKSLESGGSVVVAIDVIHQIDEHDKRHDERINLLPELLFDDLLFWRQYCELQGRLFAEVDIVVQALVMQDFALFYA